jgi:hypothetical protein
MSMKLDTQPGISSAPGSPRAPAENRATYAYYSHASMRQDATSAQAVEIGIELQELLGTSDAAVFLREQVIHIEVALRVLLQPWRRRTAPKNLFR